jgi:serralysin
MLEAVRRRFRSARSTILLSASLGVIVAVCVTSPDAWAYSALRAWDVTASGDPTRLTWGFADEGTLIPANGSSNVISFFDDLYGVATSSTNLTQRPWFSLFAESFNRWSELSGISFVYQAADDGAMLQLSPGVLGVRADIRISGKYIDGLSGALASTWLPNTGDMVLDTGDVGYFGSAVTDSLKPRNTLMHEIGHALGLMHVVSSDADLIMEPFSSKLFDGPQLDDIRGIHALYGDANEKSNNGLGNSTIGRATSLGTLAVGHPLKVGGDAAGDQFVLPTERDFVSITGSADADYYAFTISTPGLLSVGLTPRGGVLSQGPNASLETLVDANRQNDLALAVFGPNGTPRLGNANRTGAGGVEVLTGLALATPGTYYVRVLGAADAVQLYELDLALNHASTIASGDFNGDGIVSGVDLLLWQRTVGSSGIGLPADGNGDGTVDAADLALWQSSFGSRVIPSVVAVPEPGTVALLATIVVSCIGVSRVRRLIK